MKRYKHVLMIGGLSLVAIGSYFGYAAMIKGGPDYVIESVQGKATDEAVKNLHIGISNSLVKPSQYDVQLDGTIEESERNYLTKSIRLNRCQLFEGVLSLHLERKCLD